MILQAPKILKEMVTALYQILGLVLVVCSDLGQSPLSVGMARSKKEKIKRLEFHCLRLLVVLFVEVFESHHIFV